MTRFNEQVKNNLAKFDPDFMFQLTKEEFQILMSKKSTSSWGGRRKLPRAFTEQGIYMLMTVLKGDLAIAQSKALIRTFRSMKDYIIENQDLLGQRQYLQLSMISTQNTKDILDLRRDLDKVENQMADVVSSLGEVVTHSELAEFMVDFGNPKIRTGYLILNGEPVEADLAYAEIYGSAHHSVYVIDNYIGLKTLVLMKNVPEGIPITLFSDNTGNRLRRTEYEDFLKEYPNVKVNLKQTNGRFHDRYIIIDYGKDSEKIFHCGASSKDAGKKVTTITEVPEKGIYQGLIEEILQEPVLELT
ncbi:MAG: ORF6N domain-containing protein [Bulleidia sp.]|nr:ORF6N domain-containing protein [Bulleidia sp.]